MIAIAITQAAYNAFRATLPMTDGRRRQGPTDVRIRHGLTGSRNLLSDKDAIAKAHSLFSERKTQFDGFEV